MRSWFSDFVHLINSFEVEKNNLDYVYVVYVHAFLNWQRENRYQIEAFFVLPTSNAITKA